VWSEGAIKVGFACLSTCRGLIEAKTGVYHAGIGDYEKERIHVNWRKGKVKYVR
jgi:hypothetical protein